jgi:hypothetical protein
LTLWADGNWKTGSTVATVATVGKNPSAKGRLPEVDPRLTNIPLRYYIGTNNWEPLKIYFISILVDFSRFQSKKIILLEIPN